MLSVDQHFWGCIWNRLVLRVQFARHCMGSNFVLFMYYKTCTNMPLSKKSILCLQLYWWLLHKSISEYDCWDSIHREQSKEFSQLHEWAVDNPYATQCPTCDSKSTGWNAVYFLERKLPPLMDIILFSVCKGMWFKEDGTTSTLHS
jgi:hypothetical protein